MTLSGCAWGLLFSKWDKLLCFVILTQVMGVRHCEGLGSDPGAWQDLSPVLSPPRVCLPLALFPVGGQGVSRETPT